MGLAAKLKRCFLGNIETETVFLTKYLQTENSKNCWATVHPVIES
jgi:hypothetical protein